MDTPQNPSPQRRWFGRDSGFQAGLLTRLPTDTMVLAVCAWMVVVGNGALWRALLQDRQPSEPRTLWFVLATGLCLIALHFTILAPLATRWSARPLLSLMILVTAFASYFIDRFGIYLDSSMLRNVLRTDVHEASELFAWAMLPHLLLQAALPLWLLWRSQPMSRPGWRGLARRCGLWLLMAALGVGALLSVFQDAAATMRNRKELRFLITPANVLWSLSVVAMQDSGSAMAPRQAIGTDAARGPRAQAAGRRPMRVILVIGETARAANWGLNGYSRATTPRLALMPDIVSFTDVTSCGTNTEVSLPCMFSPGGRRRYDEALIRRSESLLHVLHRSGVQVLWRDNQSGCKGVCDGLPNEQINPTLAPALCASGRCFDEALLAGLDQRLRADTGGRANGAASVPGTVGTAGTVGDQLIVLHQLGNHGPAYDQRYPDAFRRFVPVCDTADLRRCSREQIVNAYDNALLYTDHVLAQAIDGLRRSSATHDTALLYVSDHGESLGENGLYLHGLPYAIAPNVQTKVPMLLWLSEPLAHQQRIDTGCLRQRASQAASHDHLFHSLLGLFDVTTAIYEPAMDVFSACRK